MIPIRSVADISWRTNVDHRFVPRSQPTCPVPGKRLQRREVLFAGVEHRDGAFNLGQRFRLNRVELRRRLFPTRLRFGDRAMVLVQDRQRQGNRPSPFFHQARATVKDAVPTDLVVLLTGVSVGLVLGWIFGKEWKARTERAKSSCRMESQRQESLARSCLSVPLSRSNHAPYDRRHSRNLPVEA